MKKIGLSLVAAVTLTAACADGGPDPLSPDRAAFDVSATSTCVPTGVGSLTANYVNETPSDPFVVTCDIGIFYDQDGVVDGAVVEATIADARAVQWGIRVEGANVDVVNSTVTSEEGFPHQFLGVGYLDGATGTVRNNDITGDHRVGVLIRGAGTDVSLDDNRIVGAGTKSTGWANNGIQIDQGSTATVKNNLVQDHWWNLDNFVSSGLYLDTEGVAVHHNTFRNNDAGMYLFGSGNNTLHNIVEVTYSEVDIEGIYGILVLGDDNGVRQSTITSAVEAGLGLGVWGSNTKLIRNTVSGWADNLIDAGEGTKLPKPFAIDG